MDCIDGGLLMNIAVTGGSGFIGSYLIEALLRRGHEITNVDLIPSTIPSVKNIIADVCSRNDIIGAVKGIDAVYHVAGLVEGQAAKNVARAYEVHAVGTMNLLNACLQHNIGWFGLASTFVIYQGAPSYLPATEASCLDLSALSPFAASKLCAELQLRDFAGACGLNYAIFRYGSAFGTGPSSNVLGDFVSSLTADTPLQVWGNGSRMNQFTFVHDIAEGSAAALTAPNGIYNLISPEQRSTAQVAEFLRQMYGAKVNYLYEKPERAQITYMCSDKALDILHWQATPFYEAINRVIAGAESTDG